MTRLSSRLPAPAAPGDFSTDLRVLILIVMAAGIGAAACGSAWVLIKLIALVTNLAWFGRVSTESVSLAGVARNGLVVAIPAIGGLIIGLMARFGSEKIRGHGIPEAIEAILIGGSRMSPKVAVLKPLSSAISIGSGGPFGAEGPIIMTGGAIGSLVAQCFHLSSAERKTLLVAGAAAGMTGIFGTPVAAVLLAVELLLFEWKPRSLIPVITAAALAMTVRPYLFETGPLFPLAAQLDLPASGLALYVLAGITAGLLSGLLTQVLYKAEDLFMHLPIHWMWWPAIGGIAVGLGGLIEPRALGVGYDVIDGLLHGAFGMHEVWLILAVKAAIWIIALASGTSGGVLAPLLIMGGAAGWLEGQYFPGDHGAWALIGMAAMMGGTMRSPLTGVLFAIELTGDFGLIVPLLIATGAAYAVTVLLLKRSILTEKIARRGQHITREYSIDPFELLRAKEVMASPADTLPAAMPVAEVIAFFRGPEPRHRSYPVVDFEGKLVGMVARADVLRWSADETAGADTLYDRASDPTVTVGYADEIVARLADRMVQADVGRVPILDPATNKVVGLVARKDLLRIRLRVQAEEQERAAYLRGAPEAVPAGGI